MADWNGVPLRLRLRSAERFRDFAISSGFRLLNTLDSRSSASLVFVTFADQRLVLLRLPACRFFVLPSDRFFVAVIVDLPLPRGSFSLSWYVTSWKTDLQALGSSVGLSTVELEGAV